MGDWQPAIIQDKTAGDHVTLTRSYNARASVHAEWPHCGRRYIITSRRKVFMSFCVDFPTRASSAVGSCMAALHVCLCQNNVSGSALGAQDGGAALARGAQVHLAEKAWHLQNRAQRQYSITAAITRLLEYNDWPKLANRYSHERDRHD
jgi:hypothetical protein